MIGLMADSHDHIPSIRQAVDFFNEEKVDLVIHAGDLISPFTATEFNRLETKFEAVFGNNDGEREGLKSAYSHICQLDDFKALKVAERKIAIIHGHQTNLVDALGTCGHYDLIVRGHSHQLEINTGKTIIINPGETCGYLSGRRTLVLLDPTDLSYEIVEL
jgi:uncharacterized protein